MSAGGLFSRRVPAAFVFARRELRAGARGLRLLVACLAVGVGAIAAATSLKASFTTAMEQDARQMLGGDLELRQAYQPPAAEARAILERAGRVTGTADTRTMARVGDLRRLVELKAVDAAYPLVGQVGLSPAQPLAQALAAADGAYGGVAEPRLLALMGLRVGDSLTIGGIRVVIRATLDREPDRAAAPMSFGPRLIISLEAMHASGVVQPGSLIHWGVRVLMAPGGDLVALRADLNTAFPSPAWEMRDTSQPSPGLERMLDNLAAFLTLVGLTALLVGGIGIANAVKAYMDGRLSVVAQLKAVGASQSQVLATYGLVIGVLAGLGIVAGLAVGATVPWAVSSLAADALPLAARVGPHPPALALAGGFGVLVTVMFALVPLARATRMPAASLLRHMVAPLRPPLGGRVWLVLAVALAGLAGLALAVSDRRGLAIGFLAGAAAILVLFRGLAWAVAVAAVAVGRGRWRLLAGPAARMALANLHRPGSAVVSMVLSLGLGLTVLVAVAEIEGNLGRQFGETLPGQAPSFFLIDVQPGQDRVLADVVAAVAPDARLDLAPMVRGRITRINGTAIDQVAVAADAQWALRGDRALTMAATQPAGTRLVAGQWWPADYAGPPLVSVEAGIAKGFGVKPGDWLTVNVLGRDLDLTVASTRAVDWTTLNMNFALILSPGSLAGAPVTSLATIHAAAGSEDAVEAAVGRALANVSAIRVGEVLEQVRAMVAKADWAVRVAAAVTLVAGALVLAGAVMAGHRARVRDTVILKVLGAERSLLWRVWLVEFGLIGMTTGAAAVLFGAVAAWAVVVKVMGLPWTFLPGVALAVVAVCVLASLGAGFAGTFAAARAKAAAYLREE